METNKLDTIDWMMSEEEENIGIHVENYTVIFL